MSLIHDCIKIQYIREGYLPNWPYHLISDEEMCDAFLEQTEDGCSGYFVDNYPLVADTLITEYNTLVTAIFEELTKLKNSTDSDYILPNWIYSYMLGNVVSVNSDILDIHDLLVLLQVDNIDDIFTPLASELCFKISKSWLSKLSGDDIEDRPPTCFGEPHVIKSLRLAVATELPDSEYVGGY